MNYLDMLYWVYKKSY